MAEDLPPDVRKMYGRALARLREEADLTQATVAQNLTVSAARVSRVESGDVELSEDEVRDFLRVIGTEGAAEFQAYLKQGWEHLSRPRFGHPDLVHLRRAEEVLQQIQGIRTPDLKSAFVNQLDLLKDRVFQCADYLKSTSHGLAFIGSIGVGKSTAICSLANMRIPHAKSLSQSMALEVGGGGTTVCEVRIRKGPRLGLRINPRSEDDIRADVTDFADFLLRVTSDASGKASSDNAAGIPRETERVIRNMSRLTVISKKDPAGKRIRRDPARELASDIRNGRELTVEILTRMDLQKRTTRTVWFPEDSPESQLHWLQSEFSRINNGRQPEFTIPDMIEVTVNEDVLSHPHLEFEIIDTKGVDQTVQREDLECHFDDPRTLVILCSGFLDSPEQACQSLLERAIAAGASRVVDSSLLLVLARPGEAAAMKDDAGEPVTDDAEGYEFKHDQVELALNRISTAPFNTQFFNAMYDDIAPVRHTIVERIESMREIRRRQIDLLATQITALVADKEREETLAVLNDALKRIRVWLDHHKTVDASAGSIQRSLLSAISTVHPRSLWASIRRRGSWNNLDYYYQIGYEARLIAARHMKSRVDELGVLVQNLLDDSDMSPAHGLVAELFERASEHSDALLKKAQLTGQTVYEEDLREDSDFWDNCDDQWGLGSGYRDRVGQLSDGWFRQGEHDRKQELVQTFIQGGWAQICSQLEEMMSDVSDVTATENS